MAELQTGILDGVYTDPSFILRGVVCVCLHLSLNTAEIKKLKRKQFVVSDKSVFWSLIIDFTPSQSNWAFIQRNTATL